MGDPLYAHPGCQNGGCLPLGGTSIHILGIGTPFNPPSWARKILMGYYTQVPRSIPRQFFVWGFRFRYGICRKYLVSNFSRLSHIYGWIIILLVIEFFSIYKWWNQAVLVA